MRIQLPKPPSANMYWRFTSKPYARWYIAPKGKAWLEEAMWKLKTLHRGKPLTRDVEISIDLYKTKRKLDLDNINKVVLDAFQKAGVIEDDAQVSSLLLHRYFVKTMKEERVEVELL